MLLETKKFKIIRTLRGLSQWDLSDLTRIPNYRLSLLETGRFNPRPKELKAIAKALGVTVEALTDAEETASLEALVREVLA